MSEQNPPPTLTASRQAKDRRTGRLLIGSGLSNLALGLVCVLLAAVIFQISDVNRALADALGQQRDQFEQCQGKPASTRGCTAPVAAEPSVIVKEGARGPIGLPGVAGDSGPAGPRGPQGPPGAPGVRGPAGPPGPPGQAGKQGPPPGCALLTTGCVGATGPGGPQGPAGAPGERGEKGEQGERGLTGERGPEGPQGPAGEPGQPGRDAPPPYAVVDADCLGDDAASHWRLYFSNGTDQYTKDVLGPCRVGAAPTARRVAR